MDVSELKSNNDSDVRDSSIEKTSVSDVEATTTPKGPQLTDKEIARLMLKVDLNVLVILAVMFLIQIVDRANIGNARIEGLTTSLNMSSQDFSNVLTTFAVAYATFEIPSNLTLRLASPRVYLPTIVLLWGAVMLASGWCTTYTHLLVSRFFLGVFESGFFPGCTFVLTLWYPRRYFGLRVALFFLCSSLAGSFSGLMAYGFAHLAGQRGLAGWSWIFICEGAITIVIALVGYILVQNDVESCTFLSEKEKAWLLHELAIEQGQTGAEKRVEEKVTFKKVIAAWSDWQVIPLALVNFVNTVPVNAMNQFLPSIIAAMGYTSLRAQLLTVPVYAVALPFIVGFAYISDKTQRRIPWLITGYLIALVGWVMLAALPASNTPGRLAGCFLIGIGIYSGFAIAASLYASQFWGKTKRAIGIATCNTAAGLSGIMSSQAFRVTDAPMFRPGCYTAIGCDLVGIATLVSLWVIYGKINEQRAHHLATTDHVYTPEEIEELGDKAPTYVYSR